MSLLNRVRVFPGTLIGLGFPCIGERRFCDTYYRLPLSKISKVPLSSVPNPSCSDVEAMSNMKIRSLCLLIHAKPMFFLFSISKPLFL